MNPMAAETMRTRRLVLEPLRIEHADEMVAVLADHGLYEFTGGEPPTAEVLVVRYRAQVAGSGHDGEQWLNWILRRSDTAEVVGFVQATVSGDSADLAWLVGADHQGQGFSVEAVNALIAELDHRGIREFNARIHPGHIASHRIAACVGLGRSGAVDDDGEEFWTSSSSLS